MAGLTVCRYCGTRDFVYSNSEGGELVAGDENDGIVKGVNDEAIMVDRYDDGWHLAYSMGPDEDDLMCYYPVGDTINYCPNCGRKLV